jgi:hypothetical protein
MDPYLEDPALWPEFQSRLVAHLSHSLQPALIGRYDAVIGTRRYTTDTSGGADEHAEDYLEIRQRTDGRLVTLVEVASPANKLTTEGREAYLAQRRQAREAQASVVEIDLVLQGKPALEYSRDGLPPWDYAVTVTRSARADRLEIYTATLQKRLPRFRLPLAQGDRDSVLDLQDAFQRCFAEGDYAGRIEYHRDPPVPLGDECRRWLDETLVSRGLRAPAPPQEEVAVAAYHIWQREGCPHGRDREHWWEALEELRARGLRPGPRDEGGAVKGK